MQCASDKFISIVELITDFVLVQFLTITFKDQSNTLSVINFYSYHLFAGKVIEICEENLYLWTSYGIERIKHILDCRFVSCLKCDISNYCICYYKKSWQTGKVVWIIRGGGGALKKLRVGLGRKASFDVNFWGFSFLQNQGYRKQGLNTH